MNTALTKLSIKRLRGVALVFLMLSIPIPALAQQGTESISQGFQTTNSNLVPGTLVSLKQGSQSMIEIASPNNITQLVGVVGNQPLLELNSGGDQAQAVINGTTPTLVSDINGTIKTGDKITVSPISGVGMKATATTQIVGTAQEDFSNVTTTAKDISDTNGKTHTVHIGLITAQISVSYYVVPQSKTSILPSFLQNFADSIAGHDVSALRLFMSGMVLLLGLVTIGVLISASIRSSIISIGRNPLSQGAVQKSLFEVGATAIAVLFAVLVAIYLILRL